MWGAIQKIRHEPIYKDDAKREVKGLRAITKWGPKEKTLVLLSQNRKN